MAPRARKPENRGLPPNLYTHPSGYRYRRPDQSYVYLGHDRGKAIEAAKAANAHYAALNPVLDRIVGSKSISLAEVINDFIEEKLKTMKIAEKTRRNRKWVLSKFGREKVSQIPVAEVTTRDLYLHMTSLKSDWLRQLHRSLLHQVFNFAIQSGLIKTNPVTPLDRPEAVRSRQRLTHEVFFAIRDESPVWLRNMMDLQLQTLQRPGDVLSLRWSELTPTSIKLTQQKTGKRLELLIEPPLREVLNRCRDDVLSPFIVHRLPEKARPSHMRAKARVHHTQVLLEQAEREFAEARTRTELFTAEDSPPTLHEIRSLGAALYRQARVPEEHIQRLLGHVDPQMTRLYLEGHEAPWDKVSAGLSI